MHLNIFLGSNNLETVNFSSFFSKPYLVNVQIDSRVESRYGFRCQWVCPSTLKALLSFEIFPGVDTQQTLLRWVERIEQQILCLKSLILALISKLISYPIKEEFCHTLNMAGCSHDTQFVNADINLAIQTLICQRGHII